VRRDRSGTGARARGPDVPGAGDHGGPGAQAGDGPPVRDAALAKRLQRDLEKGGGGGVAGDLRAVSPAACARDVVARLAVRIEAEAQRGPAAPRFLVRKPHVLSDAPPGARALRCRLTEATLYFSAPV